MADDNTIWLRSGTGVWHVEMGCEAHLQMLAGGAQVVADPNDSDGDGDVDGYEALTKASLVAELKRRGLDEKGNKPDLIARLEADDEANPVEPQPVDENGDPIVPVERDPAAPEPDHNPDGSPA